MKALFYGLFFYSLTSLSLNATPDTDWAQQGGYEQYSNGGIGVVIRADEYGVKVEEVLDNSPAFNAGITAGDRIAFVDGEEIVDLEQAFGAIRGEVGTSLSITIQRSGVELVLTIVRVALEG